MIFFTSDHHFGHENIIKHCKRPFSSVKEMDDAMVEQWNSVVTDADQVFHLGDFAHRKSDSGKVSEILHQLNGNIHLICGNHDTDHVEMTEDMNFKPVVGRLAWNHLGFDLICGGYHEIIIDGQMVVLSHYAFETWHDMRKGSWHLHGHSHGQLTKKPKRLDLGVDTHDFRPWSWDEVKQSMGGRKPRKSARSVEIF